MLFDIIWVFNNEHSGFVKLLLFLLWLLKVHAEQRTRPHMLTCNASSSSPPQRRSWPLSVTEALNSWVSALIPVVQLVSAFLLLMNAPYVIRVTDSATVWSMPGGFTSGGREGYQVVDDEPRVPVPRAPHPPPKTTIVAPTPQPTPGVQPGNYQNA